MLDWSSIIPRHIYELKPSGIRKFFDVVADMPGAISLGVGEPDFVTPYHIREAAIKSIQKGYTQYTSNWGLKRLRDEISVYLREKYDLRFDPAKEIVVTVGASEAIDVTLRALVSSGDEVLVPEPSYVSYCPCVTVAGATPVVVETSLKDEFRITPASLEAAITSRTRALIFPYPNNPTGATMSKEDIEALIPIIVKHNLIVISDEIYAELTYSGAHVSIGSFEQMRERTIVINGFSKAFAMTGWRVGYVAGPKDAIEHILKIHQYTIMCAPSASQYGALSALVAGRADGYAVVGEMKEQYDRRRRLMYSAFTAMGLECFEPQGAFYIFPSVKKTGMDGDTFAAKLVRAQEVVVVPGSAFGEFGKDHIRCCYAMSINSLTVALERMDHFIKSL